METTNETSEFTDTDRTGNTETSTDGATNFTTDNNTTVIETETESQDRSDPRLVNRDEEELLFSELRQQLESNPETFVTRNAQILRKEAADKQAERKERLRKLLEENDRARRMRTSTPEREAIFAWPGPKIAQPNETPAQRRLREYQNELWRQMHGRPSITMADDLNLSAIQRSSQMSSPFRPTPRDRSPAGPIPTQGRMTILKAKIYDNF